MLDWFSEQRSQGKSFVFFKTMNCLEQLISVRSCCNVYTSCENDRFWLASFSCCQKKSNNWNLASLLSFTEIAVSGLILELCSDADFKASLGRGDRSKHVESQTFSMDQKTTLSTTTKCLKWLTIIWRMSLRLTAKKTTMTKNFNCMKFSQTKWLLEEPPLK